MLSAADIKELYQAYVQLMDEYEQRYAGLNHEQQAQLSKILIELSATLKYEIHAVPMGLRGPRYLRNVEQVVDARMSHFWNNQFTGSLDGAIAHGADEVTRREDEIFRLIGRPGPDAHDVVSRTVAEVFTDTHGTHETVRQRITRNSQKTSSDVLNGVRERIQRGESRTAVNRWITEQITSPGIDNVRYRASRIIRTEFANASRTAHRISVTNADGTLRDGINSIGWRLSPAHPRVDICDVWASDNLYDLGPGNYPPNALPPGHPNCLCLTVTVLDLPGSPELVWKEAVPTEVPDGQRRYYAQPRISQINKLRRRPWRRF